MNELLLLTSLIKPKYMYEFQNIHMSELELKINNHDINIDFYVEKNTKIRLNDKIIIYSAKKSIFYIEKYLSKMDLKLQECHDSNLNIVFISGDTLNGGAFSYWNNLDGYQKKIYGMYDSTFDIKGEAYIFVSSESQNVTQTLIHEMAHYWYDRGCIYLDISTKTEPFAVDIEQMYIDEIMR